MWQSTYSSEETSANINWKVANNVDNFSFPVQRKMNSIFQKLHITIQHAHVSEVKTFSVCNSYAPSKIFTFTATLTLHYSADYKHKHNTQMRKHLLHVLTIVNKNIRNKKNCDLKTPITNKIHLLL